MDNGQKVILFLDRRPRQYDFLHQDAARSPFAVPPSGVYLIDDYGHVHEYFQPNNPGPYVAQGYDFLFERRVPTQKDDLGLPSLEEVRARIAATVKSVAPIRALLDRPASTADVSELMKLLVSRPRIPETCRFGTDAIASDIVEKIRSLNDPELLLRIWHLDGGIFSAVSFLREASKNGNDLTTARVKFLIQTLGDRKKDASLRIASLEILSELSMFHTGPQSGPSKVLPIDNNWLSSSAGEILATTNAIFNNQREDPELRALSVRFFDLNDEANITNFKRIYSETHSPQLQFAIEQAFLDVSDELYQSLQPSSGAVASIVQLAPEHGCVQPPDNEIAFMTRFYSTRAFNNRGAAITAGRIVLINTKSGQHFDLNKVKSRGGHWGTLDGVLVFSVEQLPDLPAGVYTLAMEYAHRSNRQAPSAGLANDALSVGHGISVAVIDSPDGKRLSIPASDGEYVR